MATNTTKNAARPQEAEPARSKTRARLNASTAPKSKTGKSDQKTPAGVTPSMAQFLEIKAANPDSILWYRMGDFYEQFFEDAKVVSKALSITLTKRGKHLGEDIPMCGVPVVRADEYLHKLIKQGFRVAVCEQLENPADARKRGAKAIVKRDVVRLVTPGTLTEDSLLDAKTGNFLTALALSNNGPALKTKSAAKNSPPRSRPHKSAASKATAALASIDISTGEFEVGLVALDDLSGELVRLNPRELIIADRLNLDEEITSVLDMLKTATTPVPSAHFDTLSGERDMKELFKLKDLGAFGTFNQLELKALSALLKYVDLTQLGAKPFTRPPRRTGTKDVLLIDAASRTSLELTHAASGDKRTTLLSCIDRTVTGPGARELGARLVSPLRDEKRINARLDALTFLFDEPALRTDLRKNLKSSPDIARAISRLAFNRGSPRDQANVRDALACATTCANLLGDNSGPIGLPEKLEELRCALAKVPSDLFKSLRDALIDEPTANKREFGFISPGYNLKLDEANMLKQNGHQVMAQLEAKYAQQTGIKTLKIRHNNILGYFIEVRQANADELQAAPHRETFRHRQSIASAARFTSDELDDTQTRISTASQTADSIETQIFADLSSSISQSEHILGTIAAALASLDVTAALAELAQQQNYTRPKVDNSRTFAVFGGRHPVVEQALKAARQVPFIENDCILGTPPNAGFERENGNANDTAKNTKAASTGIASSTKRTNNTDYSPPPGFDDTREHFVWLVTGPNMAGKSTFLRQNALIAILAQIGSYVPAQKAHIGVIDRLFSRVGASDDLARGRSTFMVEMVETASILNLATDRSLVILDEIGRGTATFDGLSIAWACIEYLHDVTAARTLFATHYHEMTVLPERLRGIKNVTIDVKEWRDEIIFLHKVRSGAADRSYGIQVGKLAGLPKTVIDRAKKVLAILEAHGQRGATTRQNPLDELPLFAATAPLPEPAPEPEPESESEPQISRLEKALDDINPDELTPRDALELLYQLKNQRLIEPN